MQGVKVKQIGVINNDLIKAFGSDKQNHLNTIFIFGKYESRSLTLFSTQSYLYNYSDLRNSFGNDHKKANKNYIKFGLNEGRAY